MSEESEIFYVVLCLKESLGVNGMETKISNESGFAGYLPVFRTYKYAEKFSKGKFNVVAIALKKRVVDVNKPRTQVEEKEVEDE